MANTLSVGDIVHSDERAKAMVLKFNQDNFVDFVVETNNQKSLRFVCKHGARQRARSKGQRPKQHQNFLDCKAAISFYKSLKNGTIKCTKIYNEHNHPVSEQIYKSKNVALTEEEIVMSSNLRSGNCKPSQIKRILLEKFNKQISIQKLKNVLAKTPGEDQDDNIDFEEFFEEFENEGGDVDWQEDPDGTVRCMTFSSNKMKNAFKSSDAPLVQLDTTFDMEKARYKVLAVVYLNPATNKSEVAFMALLCDESKPNVEFALQTFKKICLRYDLIFIVDKDFGQLEVLNSVFPTALVLLCVFHVIKFMKSLIASAPVVVDVKKDLPLVLQSKLETSKFPWSSITFVTGGVFRRCGSGITGRTCLVWETIHRTESSGHSGH